MSHLDDVKRYKSKRKAKGLCPWCDKPKGKTYLCESCNDKHISTQADRRNKLKGQKEYW